MNFGNNVATSTNGLDANGIATTTTSMGIPVHYGQNLNQAHHSGHHGFTHSAPSSNFNLGSFYLKDHGHGEFAPKKQKIFSQVFVSITRVKNRVFDQK
jgi:hypothetical protein